MQISIGAVAVLLAYALPFLMNSADRAPFLNVAVHDEKIYLARVVDAYRGGSLGNPYLAERQNAVRFMPELGERVLALAAHATGVKPLLIVGISRFVFPVLIYLLLWSLARGLGLEPRWATLAAILCPLMPSISWLTASSDAPGFLRYFRAISPGFYVILLVVALRMVLTAWQKPSWWTAVVGGATLGLLFYTPPYFWSFALLGVVGLTLSAHGRVRMAMLMLSAVALLVALPSLWSSLQRAQDPEVQATLARFDLLIPGRSPDIHVPGSFALAIAIMVPLWLWRRKLGASGRFLLPFIGVGTILMVQNVVTNRHLQSYHWIECLIPTWALATGAFLQAAGRTIRSVWINTVIGALLAGSLFAQTRGYLQWKTLEKEYPEFWALDARMPGTLLWLDQHTPNNSVVLADGDVMDSLVLFTHNKVYWADYAGQHVLSEAEVLARTRSLESFHPNGAATLPFRVDFYLGTGPECQSLRTGPLLYHNDSEHTCVTSFSTMR